MKYHALLVLILFAPPALAQLPTQKLTLCQQEWRKAWREQRSGLANFNPCEPRRINDQCMYYPQGFVSFDYARDCGKGKACAQREFPPGLYCWSEAEKTQVYVSIPKREPSPMVRLPTRK